jgi:signal transduction histidine kinase
MGDPRWSVLLVEDDEDDYELARRLLLRPGGTVRTLDWAQTYEQGAEAIGRRSHDAYILDYRLGARTGLDLVQLALEHGRDVPLILLTGGGGPDVDVAALRAGADDYLPKETLAEGMLERSIRYAIERRRLEAKLRDKQRFESLATLAGGVAHDFNNLLVGVLGGASLARTRLASGEDVSDDLRRIEESSERAAALVRQMLAYAGLETYSVGSVDLADLVVESAPILESAASRQHRLVLELEGGLPLLEADPARLEQMLVNLVANAAEAGGAPGSAIEVAVRSAALSPADLHARGAHEGARPGEYVVVTVADEGAGIEESLRGRIFDPFFTTKFLGRGLGLPAALGIVRAHEGWIRAGGRPGGGTVVEVYLPTPDARTGA